MAPDVTGRLVFQPSRCLRYVSRPFRFSAAQTFPQRIVQESLCRRLQVELSAERVLRAGCWAGLRAGKGPKKRIMCFFGNTVNLELFYAGVVYIYFFNSFGPLPTSEPRIEVVKILFTLMTLVHRQSQKGRTPYRG